jgi:phosphate transport system protein
MEVAHHHGLIANQFELISRQLKDIDARVPDRRGTGETLAEMAALAAVQLDRAAGVFARRDASAALQLERDDDEIDSLNRVVFQAALTVEGEPRERALALGHALIARSLERIADNAVDIAEQAAFLATGEPREFSDASRPKAAQRAALWPGRHHGD